MLIDLSPEEINIVLESLKYSKLKIENLPVPEVYPTIEFRDERVMGISNVINKIKSSKK